LTRRMCSVCARGGSKGVAGKNVRELAGVPLIGHTLRQISNSGMFETIAVSSDSDEILSVAQAYGADVLVKRPDELASDTAPKSAAILHCAEATEARTGTLFDTFFDLDATAPLRTPEHIRAAVEQLEMGESDNLFSVCVSRRSPWFNMVRRDPDGTISLAGDGDGKIVRRQDAPQTYDMNASIYGWKRAPFFAHGAKVITVRSDIFVMPEITVIDVDSETDFRICELVLPHLHRLL